MTITADEKFLLNNKMGSIARKVQLGTLISNAESVTAGEIVLADGSVLIGSAAGIGAAKALSGDITTDRDGVTAIGAGKVLESMLSDTNSATRLQKFSVGFADLNTAGDGVPALFGVAIPDGAIIKRVFYDVTTTFGGDGDDSSLISMGLEDQDNDVVIAVAIKTAGDAWDLGLHEGIQDGTAATMIKLTAARQLAVTVDYAATDAVLDAGAMDVYVEWVPGTAA